MSFGVAAGASTPNQADVETLEAGLLERRHIGKAPTIGWMPKSARNSVSVLLVQNSPLLPVALFSGAIFHASGTGVNRDNGQPSSHEELL